METKFESFIQYEKYNYTFISKPNQTIKEQIHNTFFIFNNRNHRSNYIKDIVALSNENKFDYDKRKTLLKWNKYYKYSEFLIFGFISFSLRHHYKKGYFSTNSRLIDAYILGKMLLYIYGFFAFKFSLLKYNLDPILFEYYSVKEFNNALYSDNLVKTSNDIRELSQLRSKPN